MQDPRVIRGLFRLAERISVNAEFVRNASKPHHLKRVRKRFLRHLHEINAICDNWADTYRPTRRKKPIITQYDVLTHWDKRFPHPK